MEYNGRDYTRAPRCRRKQEGQSLPEFLIVVPVFLFLLLLVFQLVLIFRAKSTLDYAVLEAARAGAIHKADKSEMMEGLARGLTPLYATEGSAVGLGKAIVRARADLLINSKIDVISPTPQMWHEFKEKQYNGKMALPNDNLAFRDTTVKASGVNVQDANVLKIRVTYHYPLVVPFVDRVLRGRSDYVRSNGFFDPANVDMKNPILSGPVLGSHFRIPLESHAMVRMQTSIDDPKHLR